MRLAAKPFKRLILVCTNARTDGRECCAQKGSEAIFEELKAAVKAAIPGVRVSRTGCLDNCATGTSVVLMPEELWLGGVELADIPSIVSHLSGNTDLKRGLAA